MARQTEILDEEQVKMIRKNNRKKAFVGLLLLIAVVYLILTNTDLRLPVVGVVTEGERSTCVETRGPKYLTDTEITKLKVKDNGFEIDRERNSATIIIENIDERSGTVRVTLFCEDGEEQGAQTKEIMQGADEEFTFTNVAECDMNYLLEPQIIRTTVNRTAYVTETKCD